MLLKQKAYQRFKEKLFKLSLKPGQFVTQNDLSQLLEVPVGALRDAIQKLEMEGLVSVIPQRGIQITEMNIKRIKDAYQVRTFIENEAIRYFTKNANPAVIEKLEKSLIDIITRHQSGDTSKEFLSESLSVDYAFHETIIDEVGNELLSNTFRQVFDKIRIIWLDSSFPLRRVLPAMQEHMEIIRAIKKNDPELAAAACEKHLTTSMMRALGI